MGCNVLQIFTKSPNSWKEKELTDYQVNRFISAKKETGMKSIISHTSYLINLAGNSSKKVLISREALKKEMLRASVLDISYVVHHPGFHTGAGEKEGIKLISEGINYIFNEISCHKVRLLLETGAGQGTCVGYNFESLAEKYCFNATNAWATKDVSTISPPSSLSPNRCVFFDSELYQ